MFRDTAAAIVLTRSCPLSRAKIAKKSEAIAATPAQRPSMWSRILNDAVMPTTKTIVSAVSAQIPAVPGQTAEKTCARIPEMSRITAAAGIAPKSLI